MKNREPRLRNPITTRILHMSRSFQYRYIRSRFQSPVRVLIYDLHHYEVNSHEEP